MKRLKVLKIKEFTQIGRHLTPTMNLSEVSHENLKTKNCKPLYESSAMPVTDKTTNAIIVLPSNLEDNAVNADSLSATITNFIDNFHKEGDMGVSIGYFFAGDYCSAESIWNNNSLCVSLYGVISDYETTMATALEIIVKHNLPRILILLDNSALEIANQDTQSRTQKRPRIKRLCD